MICDVLQVQQAVPFMQQQQQPQLQQYQQQQYQQQRGGGFNSQAQLTGPTVSRMQSAAAAALALMGECAFALLILCYLMFGLCEQPSAAAAASTAPVDAVDAVGECATPAAAVRHGGSR